MARKDSYAKPHLSVADVKVDRPRCWILYVGKGDAESRYITILRVACGFYTRIVLKSTTSASTFAGHTIRVYLSSGRTLHNAFNLEQTRFHTSRSEFTEIQWFFFQDGGICICASSTFGSPIYLTFFSPLRL